MFWKIFAKAKISILMAPHPSRFAIHLPPPGKADFESANISYRDIAMLKVLANLFT